MAGHMGWGFAAPAAVRGAYALLWRDLSCVFHFLFVNEPWPLPQRRDETRRFAGPFLHACARSLGAEPLRENRFRSGVFRGIGELTPKWNSAPLMSGR